MQLSRPDMESRCNPLVHGLDLADACFASDSACLEKKLLSKKNEHAYSPPSILSPLAWRASPPALGIAYCTRLPWAPPARWGFPALSGSLALNLGSLPNAGRMSDEVSALVCPFPVMASPGLATMNESSHSQGTPAYLAPLSPPSSPPFLSPR